MSNEESNPIGSEEDSVLRAIFVGLKNGLEREESMEKAKQTMVNAGYDPRKVEEASRELELMDRKENNESLKDKKKKLKKIPHTKKTIVKKERDLKNIDKLSKSVNTKPSKRKIWIYVVTTIIVLVLAALLGLYWDKITGLF